MGFLLTFLSGPYKFLIMGAAILAAIAGIYLYGRHAGVESMRPDVEAAKSEAELWKKTADNRKTLIEAQNQAVAGLKAASDMRVSNLKNQLAVANSEASKFRKEAEKKAETLLTMKLPENECSAVFSLIDEARK